jgi:hypothetical protein
VSGKGDKGSKGGAHREPKTWGGSKPPKLGPWGGGKHAKPSGGKHEGKGGGEGRGPKGDE